MVDALPLMVTRLLDKGINEVPVPARCSRAENLRNAECHSCSGDGDGLPVLGSGWDRVCRGVWVYHEVWWWPCPLIARALPFILALGDGGP